MNKKIFFCIPVLAFAARIVLWLNEFPSDYESLSAENKLDWLWHEIQADEGRPGAWPGTWDLIKLISPAWLGGMDVKQHVGETKSDQFQREPRRPKAIHSVGGVAKVKFVFNSKAQQYTGAFQKAEYALARFSSASKPTPGKSTPALSVKILRDGKASGNFFAMWELDAQDSHNIFKHPLCNHVPSNPKDGAVSQLVKKFTSADPRPSMIGLKDVAMINQDGTLVPTEDIKAPFALVMQPNPELTSQFADFQLQEGSYAEYLSQVPEGTVLYRVYAVDAPNTQWQADQPALIGELRLASQVVKSNFADSKLLFKHVFMNEELATNARTAAWEEYIEQGSFLEEEGAGKYSKFLPPWKKDDGTWQ